MQKEITEYLAWKGTYAPRAAQMYRVWLERFLEVNGSKALSKYAVADIVRYRLYLEKYSPYTAQFATVAVQNFFKYWKLQGKSCLSPELIKVGKTNPKSHRAVTEDEVSKILAVIDESSFAAFRDRIIVRMLWETGVRVSELTSLNIEQISRSRNKTSLITKKNNKRRIIVWSKETHILLSQYLELRQILTNTSPLFISNCMSGNTRLTPRSIERIVSYYARKASITEKVTPHSFRHGYAHHRRDKYNAPLSFISRALGHQNPVSTFIYEQYSDTEFESQAEKYL
jgi:site-specific recombinase XerD